jgi:hypothetical protein
MKVRFLACLICLAIVVVSLDSVPDPPAITCHDNATISALDFHAYVSLQKAHRTLSNHVVSVLGRCIFSELCFERAEIAYQQPPIFHATDASPPLL